MAVLISQASIFLVFAATTFVLFLNAIVWIRLEEKNQEVLDNDSTAQCTKCYDYALRNPGTEIYYADCACTLEDCREYCGSQMNAIHNCTLYQLETAGNTSYYSVAGWNYDWDVDPTLDVFRCSPMPDLDNLQCFGGVVSAKDDTFHFRVVGGMFSGFSFVVLVIAWVVFFMENSMNWDYEIKRAEQLTTWSSLVCWMVAFLGLTEIFNARLDTFNLDGQDINCYQLAIPKTLNTLLYYSYGVSFLMFWGFMAMVLTVSCSWFWGDRTEDPRQGMAFSFLVFCAIVLVISITTVVAESVVTLYFLQKEDLFVLLLLGLINVFFAFVPPVIVCPRKSHSVTFEQCCDSCFKRRMFFNGVYYE